MNWIPTIEVENNQGIREMNLMTRHLMNRRIFLNDRIDANMANSIVSQIMYLRDESDKPIEMIINSPGGSITDGLIIYDVIQNLDVELNMYCTGIAASMAAILLAGGQKGRRFILPHSKVMIHEPLLSEGVGGSASSIKNISDSLLRTRKMVNAILAKHTGKSIAAINKATAYDHYMDAQESIKFGICDKVCDNIVSLLSA